MKLKEYMKNLSQLIAERPEVLEFEVVTSIDDEGNGYNVVYFGSSIGVYDDHEFYSEENIEEEPDEYNYTKDDCNAVCVN